jgi:hypothetical protein
MQEQVTVPGFFGFLETNRVRGPSALQGEISSKRINPFMLNLLSGILFVPAIQERREWESLNERQEFRGLESVQARLLFHLLKDIPHQIHFVGVSLFRLLPHGLFGWTCWFIRHR